MPSFERVTVTLSSDVLKEVDRREKNRSRFVAEAVRKELQSRRAEELQLSLNNPHPESAEFSDPSFEEWARSLPVEDTEVLLDGSRGRPVRWIPGEGWVLE